MTRHPAFDQALARLVEGLLAAYRAGRQCTRAIADHRRYGVAALILHMDKRHVAGEGPACTRQRLIGLAAPAHLGTRRGIRGIVGTLTHLGFVAEAALPGDRRARRLVPRPPLIELFTATLLARIDAARLLLPPGRQPPPSSGAQGREWMYVHLAQLIGAGPGRTGQPRDAFPEVAPFAARLSGYLVMFALIAGEKGPRRVNVDALARSLHVSRTQVMKVLAAAEAAGLLHRHGRGSIRWEEGPRERLRLFAAMELARAVAATTGDVAMAEDRPRVGMSRAKPGD